MEGTLMKSLAKTILFTLFYLAMAYYMSYVALEYHEWFTGFEVIDNWDRINSICLGVLMIVLGCLPFFLITIAFLVFNQYMNSLKDRGNY